jgi:hypothetical protein
MFQNRLLNLNDILLRRLQELSSVLRISLRMPSDKNQVIGPVEGRK